MPLYETVMQEKPPIVLDIGTAYTKLGFAAEAYPRKIISSEIMVSDNGGKQKLFDYDNNDEFYDQIVDFLQTIFFKYLLVSPKERKIVVVENVFGSTAVRETIASALFRHFEVSSIMYVPSHMIALSTLAVPTGVVIDIGYNETTVLPIFGGVQIMKAFKDQSYGGKAIHKIIKKNLVESGVNENLLNERIIEDIKIRTCFVTTLERAQAYRDNDAPIEPPTLEYPIYSDNIIPISGRLRETSFEVMFDENNERDSLPHLILQSILKCPMDVRKQMSENLFIIGGSSIIMGLTSRVKEELQYLLETDKVYKQKFHGDIKFKFHKFFKYLKVDQK